MHSQSSYSIPASTVDKLITIGRAMVSLAEEIKARQAQVDDHATSIPIPDLTPPATIASEDAWFWSEPWQVKEKEASEDIKAGRISIPFETADDLMAALERPL